MGSLGIGELLVILVIVLLIFGAGKLPQVEDSLGKAIRNFKSSASGENDIEVSKRKEIAAREAADADDVSPVAKVPAEKKSK